MLPLEGAGRPKGGSFLWAKPVVFRRAVAASRHGVLLADIDVVFYQDLLPWVKRHWTQNPDVVLVTGTEWGTCCNTGTVYAEKRSLPLLDMWVEANHRWYQRHLGDQDALLELVVFNVSNSLNISNAFKLPYPQDAIDKDKTYPYRISLFDEAVVMQQGRKCRGCDGCRGPCKSGKAPYANHYNAIQMHMQPEHFLDSRGNWSDDVDMLATGRFQTRQRMMIQSGDWCALDELEGLFAVPEEGSGSSVSSGRGGIYHRDAGGVYHRDAGGVYNREAGRGLQR